MKKLKKLFQKQGFTLVELIIVIAIIAVLAVAAFMMLTKWLGKSRDSRRLGDLKTIQKGLNIGYTDEDMGNGFYPDISEQSGAVLLYSGDDTKKLAYQGIVDLSVSNQANLQKVPLDPSDKNKYTYLVTKDRKKFQLMAMLENGTEVTALVNQAYALDYKNRTLKVVGYNLGVLLTSGTNIPIQFVGGSLTGINLSDNAILENYKAKAKEGEEAVSGTGIQELDIYTQGIASSSGDDEEEESTSSNTITESDCVEADWMWVDEVTDTIGDGFCISPRVGGGTYISWLDIGTNYSWNRESSSPLFENAMNTIGVTYDLGNYICKGLGTAEGGLTKSDDTDSVLASDDTIVNRMRYIAKYKTHSTALDIIDWVTITIPTNATIPAIMIADCIDGERNLTTGNIYEGVTYSEYSNPTNDTTGRININKYLLGWTKSTGSHLPSAYSDISSELLNSLAENKGEYQIACEANKFASASNSTGSEDIDDGRRVWLASVGKLTSGDDWGSDARIIGSSTCKSQSTYVVGNIYYDTFARFVVR